MTASLWLVCDQSGSMREEARRFIVRDLVRGVEQFVRLRPSSVTCVRLVAWRDESTVVEWSTDDEFPDEMLDCRATLKDPVIASLEGIALGDKVLVFTDGSWSQEARTAIDAWRRDFTQTIRFVKVGSDVAAALVGLDVLQAEDLIGSLEGWLTK